MSRLLGRRFWTGLAGLTFLLLLLGYTSTANAQLSPWLSLDTRPTGDLDSYHQYVRPQQQYTSALTQQQQQINRQQQQQQQMMKNAGSLLAPQRNAGSRSYAASYRNYSHYYTMPRMSNRR